MGLRFVFFVAFAFIFESNGAAVFQKPLRTEGLASLVPEPAAHDDLPAEFQDSLIEVKPIGAPCYTQPGPLDKSECATARQLQVGDVWISDQPGGYFFANWASCQRLDQKCALPLGKEITIPSDKTCFQGAVPSRMIKLQNDSKSIKNVQEAFRCAQSTNSSVVIKNTGHDWKGRSAAPASLAIWTHIYRPGPVLDRSFVPFNCSDHKPETVIHFGGGETWGGAYNFADKNNLTVVGGTCKSVGIAGWLHGGGHSPLTPTCGLGIDNVRQIELITPNGELQVANECHNQDLFFAVRGGGGGTFGVVTNIAYKALPKFGIHNFHVELNETAATPEFFSILTKHGLQWSRKGWGGYIRPGVSFDIIKNASTSLSEAKEDVSEMFTYLKSLGFNCTVVTRSSWYDHFNTTYFPPSVHPGSYSMAVGSRLLEKELFNQSSNREATAKVLFSMYDSAPNISLWIMLVAPTAYIKSTIHTSSLNPSWSNAIWSVRLSSRWDQFTDIHSPRDSYDKFATNSKAIDPLRRLAPSSGVSISEADIWEPNHEQAFWGQVNYEKLAEIKRRVDPGNVLVNWHGIGWNENKAMSDERFQCYPQPPKLDL